MYVNMVIMNGKLKVAIWHCPMTMFKHFSLSRVDNKVFRRHLGFYKHEETVMTLGMVKETKLFHGTVYHKSSVIKAHMG